MTNQKRPRKSSRDVTRSHAKPPTATAFHPSSRVSQAVLAAMTDQEAGASLDLALSRALKATPGLDPKERRQVVKDLNEINRHRARLTWHLEQDRIRLSPHNLFLAWTGFESREAPVGIRITEADRALIAHMKTRTLADPEMPEAVRVECPEAFERPLRESLGAAFAAEMTACLEAPPVDLRVNTLKGTVADARRRLKSEGIATYPTPFSPWGLRAQPGSNVSPTTAFNEGLIEFQDEGSQVAALLCDARAGMQVMDFCSGTGGKTLALGAAMNNRGHLVACDVSTVRLARAKLRLKRAHVENAERILLPQTDDKALKKRYAHFDRILVDAPCSGTGSWRRNPDARWSTQAANVAELTTLQDAILERASRFVKPGGRLIYATCSLLRRENDERVAHFLKAHPEFEQLDARVVWKEVTDRPWPSDGENVLRLSPAKHGTDGFFAAVLHRRTLPPPPCGEG